MLEQSRVDINKLPNDTASLSILTIFLREVDSFFVRPLSAVQDLDAYAEKLLRHGNVLLATEGNRPAGLVAGYLNDPGGTAFVSILATLPPYRSAGLGQSLIDTFVTQCRNAGMARVRLFTDESNSARRLYHRYGFSEVSDDGPGRIELVYSINQE